MATLAASWIPEDDLLLKNAVEAGASLESLAKGAVRFSRKFTVVEIRDRWRSLLYDPLVSAEAALRMSDLEVSSRSANNGTSTVRSAAAAGVGGFRGSHHQALKRKFECVKQLFYSLKKKSRRDSVGDFGTFVGPEEMFVDDKRGGDDVGNCSVAMTQECDFVDISDALLNFVGEEQPVIIDVGTRGATDKTSYDDLDLLLVSTPKASNGNVAEDCKELASVLDTGHEVPESGCSAVLEVISEQPLSAHVSSTTSRNVDCIHVEMVCVLNTEDDEIPCNDDVMFAKALDISVPGMNKKKGSRLLSASAKPNDGKQELRLITKEEDLANFSTVSPLLGKNLSSLTGLGSPLVRRGSKLVPPNSKALAIVSTEAGTSRVLCQNSSDLANSPTAAIGPLKAEAPPTYTSEVFSNAREVVPASEVDPLAASEEESESDDDLPSFSDIEALILGMDLCPDDDSDSYVSREVARYQNEDSRRSVIRLEQCAHSCMQRAIASCGAIAVLYGRHLKHYIRQTEVVLGRATQDMDVDIDLGKEGPAHKISRRQALIKLEVDGSFSLKNLGKSPMFLNGKEVPTGQILRVNSNSLIEIRDLAFAFETNSKSVRQYMANIAKNNREGNVKFAWSDEMVP